MTLFHEVHGLYYRTVSDILRKALTAPVTRADMIESCNRVARGESALTIPDALLTDRWPLLTPDGQPLLRHDPKTPLTTLELRWLKAISLDPRMKLFDVDFAFLNGVEPLFTPDDVLRFDQYTDGDDYADPGYIRTFRTLLTAIREEKRVRLTYVRRKAGGVMRGDFSPLHLEYSAKDDCFRVLCVSHRRTITLRVSQITGVRMIAPRPFAIPPEAPETKSVVLEITDDRNALERVSLHFAHLRKTVERTGPRTYRMTLHFDPQDETELVIRVLQFGPVVQVVSPDAFSDAVKMRIKRQLALFSEGKSL